MKKFFALALTAAMVISLAVVSFAVEGDIVLNGPYRYESGSHKMIMPKKDEGAEKDTLRYGYGVYYLIKIDDGDGPKAQTDYKKIEKLKVKADFKMGEDFVSSLSIVKKRIDCGNQIGDDIVTNGGITEDGFYYFVEFKIASMQTVSEADIIATLEFDRKADSRLGTAKIKNKKCDTDFTVFYKSSWNGSVGTIVTDKENLKWDTSYALKFDCDDEIELSFGIANGGNNEGSFTVDVSGQGKIFLKYNTNADDAIVEANPGARIIFLNFGNVKFNRVGKFVYEMDNIAAAYKVVDGKLVEIKGAEMNTDSVSFNTRVLESYVFADAELVNPAVADI